MTQYVYFIGPVDKGIGLVKIGVSCDIRARLRTLQTAAPFPLECYEFMEASVKSQEVERWLHTVLAHKRTHGEWFKMTTADIYEAVQIVSNIMEFSFWVDNDETALPPRVEKN